MVNDHTNTALIQCLCGALAAGTALSPWGAVLGWGEGASAQQGLEPGVTPVPTRPQCRGRWGMAQP